MPNIVSVDAVRQMVDEALKKLGVGDPNNATPEQMAKVTILMGAMNLCSAATIRFNMPYQDVIAILEVVIEAQRKMEDSIVLTSELLDSNGKIN